MFSFGRKYLTITIPYYDYIRTRVFISDLRDNYGDDVPYNFDVAVLIFMLFDDFLNQIKRGAKHDQIANYLTGGRNRYFQNNTKLERILKPITPHVLEFETVEEETEYDKSKEEKMAYITLRMREAEVLRAEVLLHDLFNAEGIEMTVEELIVIVYLDFIQSVKIEGNSLKVQKTILTHLKAH